MKGKTVIIYLVLIMVALLPRVLLVIFSSASLTGDEITYNSLASSIIHGKGFSILNKPFIDVPPVYPYFLALIYRLLGYSFINIRLIQAFIGSIICVLVYLICKRLFNRRAVIIAFLLTVFNPALIKSCERIRSECLFIFLVMLSVLILMEVYKKPRTMFLILLGVNIGLATLTRGIFILFPLFFIASLMFIKTKKGLVKYSLITILFFSLTLAPWVIRNWFLLHAFVPVTTQTGLAFYSSFNPRDGKFYGFNAKDQITEEADKLNSEVAKSSFLTSQTLKSIKKNLPKLPRIELLKFLYFWAPFDWEIIGEGKYNFIYGFIFPFLMAGFIFTIRNFRDYFCLYLPIIYFQTMALIFYGSPRFRLPIEPYLIIIASAGIAYFIAHFSKKIYGFLLTGFYFLLNLLLYFSSYQVKLFFKYIFEKVHLW